MTYIGKLYGKCGRQLIPLQMTSEDVDKMQADLDQWKSRAIQWEARFEYAESELVKLAKPTPNLTYSSTQETSCAWCDKRKHTPLRRDEMGGYVCLTCIDRRLDRLTKALETVCHCDDKAIVGEDSEREIVKRLAVAIDAAENGLVYPGPPSALSPQNVTPQPPL
jgi:hypothetical protein